MVGARDRDLAGLERLAQRRRAPAAGTPAARRGTARRDARARSRPAAPASRRRPAPACWRNGAGCGTAARLVSAPPSISPATEATIDTSSSSGRRQRRQDRGSRAASIDLPAPGGPTMQQVVAAGGGDLERALGALLALDVLEVDERASASRTFGCGRASTCVPRK